MKSKNKIFIYSLIIFIVASLTVLTYIKYNSNVSNKGISTINTSNFEKSEILSYEDYERLFENIVNNINVPGLELKASTIGNNVTSIDKELSFNKRQYLTLDGNLNVSNATPTDEQLTLEDKSQSKQITIGFFYTKNYIGNDLIGWPNNVGFDNLNKNLADKTSCSVITYKNLVILINQTAVDKIDLNTMDTTMKSLITLLNKFK